MTFSPEQPEPAPQNNPTVLPKQKEKEPSPLKYKLEVLTEAPLVQKKILLTKPVAIYPSQGLMQEKFGGVTERNIPAQFYVIQTISDAKNNVTQYHLGNSNGESVGWVTLPNSKESGYEWSTNRVWSPNTDTVPLLFPSPDAASAKNGGMPMPKELIDSEYAFPILKADDINGLFQIGRPLPGTVQTNVKFPLWISTRPKQGEDSLLVDKKSLEDGIRNIELLLQSWAKFDEVARDIKKTEPLFKGTRIAICSLACGNIVMSGSTDDELDRTESFVNSEFQNMTIDSILTMNDQEFAAYTASLKSVLARLKDAAKKETSYSIHQDGKLSRRVLVDL